MSSTSRKPFVADPAMWESMGLTRVGNVLIPDRLNQTSALRSLKPDIKRALKELDLQDYVTRGQWYGLPNGITGELIERMLYYRGRICAFQINGKFYFLPFALCGTIDVYGRYNEVTPLPFTGGVVDDAKEDPEPWIDGLTFKVMYDVPDYQLFFNASVEEQLDVLENCCVILNDRSQGYSQNIVPRCRLQEPIIDLESDMLPFMRSALLNATGVAGMRIPSESQKSEVELANSLINQYALDGRRYVPVVGELDFQDLSNGGNANADQYLMAMEAIDNFRLQLHGISNGGLFQKNTQVLQSENDMNAQLAGSVERDMTNQRQEFCTIMNMIFGTEMWYEPYSPDTLISEAEQQQYQQEEEEGEQEDVNNATDNG